MDEVGRNIFDDISGGGWTSSYTGEWLSLDTLEEEFMPAIWREEYSTGPAVMDIGHKNLLAEMNALARTINGSALNQTPPLLAHATVYTDGRINANTASIEVLLAVKGGAAPDQILQAMVAQRAGADGRFGTFDDCVLRDHAEAVQDLARRVLESAGYTVLTASNGPEALAILERHDGPVHLVLTDMIMPGMSGQDLVAQIEEISPSMKVLYTSGYTDEAILRDTLFDKATHFIGKPYTAAELTRRVREVLDSPEGHPTTG